MLKTDEFDMYATYSAILILTMPPTGLSGPVYLPRSLSRVFQDARVRGKNISSAWSLKPNAKN